MPKACPLRGLEPDGWFESKAGRSRPARERLRSRGCQSGGPSHVAPCLARGSLLTLAGSLCSGRPASRTRVRLGETRTLSMFNIHTKEAITVTFKKDGNYDAGRAEAAQPFHARLAANEAARHGSRLDRPDLDPAPAARVERAGQAHLRPTAPRAPTSRCGARAAARRSAANTSSARPPTSHSPTLR